MDEYIKETIMLVLVIVGFFVGVAFLIDTLNMPAHGHYKGYVTSIEKVGLGHDRLYLKTELESSDEIRLCSVKSIRPELEKALDNRELVKLEYEDPLWLPFWKCFGSNTIVIKIK